MLSSHIRPVRAFTGLLVVAVIWLTGCGGTPTPQPKPENPPETKPADKEPTPEAKLTAGGLFSNPEKYKGKWVAVSGIVPRINLRTGPGDKTSARVLIQDSSKDDVWAEFDDKEWPKVPKLEDGVRYEVMGKVRGSKDTGVSLENARYLGSSSTAGPAAEAKMTTEELVASGSKFKDKLIQVKGIVLTGSPGDTGGTATLAAGDKRTVICLFSPGEFDKATKAARGGTLELKGTVADVNVNPTLGGCTVVSATPVKRPDNAVNISRAFAKDATKAEAGYKGKMLTLTGKVEAVAENKITLTGFVDPKMKTAAQKVVANFGPGWKDKVGQVKVGNQVTISGDFNLYQKGELDLSNCWLLPN